MSDELIEIFVAEGRELIDQAAAAIATLRNGGQDAAALDELFRAFHTLKGSAGLMGFGPMAEVFHAGEDRLAAARGGDGRLDGALADALLAVLDQTEAWLDAAAPRRRDPGRRRGTPQPSSSKRFAARPTRPPPPPRCRPPWSSGPRRRRQRPAPTPGWRRGRCASRPRASTTLPPPPTNWRC